MKCKIPDRYSRFEGIKIPTIKKWMRSIRPKLKEIPDPRGRQGRQYPLYYILELYLVSCLAGYCDCLNCVEFLKSKQDIINQFIGQARKFGIPSHDCFCDCLAVVEEEQMESILKEFDRLCCKSPDELAVLIKTRGLEWLKKEERYHKNGRPFKYEVREREVIIKKHICMDGKSSIAATDRKRGGTTPYTGGFYDATSGCFTGLKFIANGKEEGEATVLRQALLDRELRQTITTADALHTSSQTMEAIRSRDGEFLLRLKGGSHPRLFELIVQELEASKGEAETDRRRLEAAARQGEKISTPALDRYQEKSFLKTDKARITKTTIQSAVDDENLCSDYSPHITQIIRLKSTTTELLKDENKETQEIVSDYECCFVCSCVLEADEIYQLITEHWHIESAHWVLDNYFGEDHSTGHTGHQIFNRALFKRIAFNLLKLLEKCVVETAGMSTRNKFIFLREHFGIALMMVNGLENDYYGKMANVYQERKKAYSRRQKKEVDLTDVTLTTM